MSCPFVRQCRTATSMLAVMLCMLLECASLSAKPLSLRPFSRFQAEKVAVRPDEPLSLRPFSHFQGEKVAVRPDEGVRRDFNHFSVHFAAVQVAPAAADETSAAADQTATKLSATTEKPPSVHEIPLAHKPYSVQVTIGFDGSGTQHSGVRDMCTTGIRSGLNRTFGIMWDAQVAASDWLIPANETRLRRLTDTELAAKYSADITDKVILISVASADGAFTVSCREYDTRVQELSPVLSEQTHDVRSVPDIACRLARDCFRPVLLMSGPSTDKSELEFDLQAGCLNPPDPSAAQISEGDVLRTFIRQMDRRSPDKLKLLQKLDLVYVRVTSFNEPLPAGVNSADDKDVTIEGTATGSSEAVIDSGHVRGVLISHGLVPFGGKGRSQQQIALRQRPSAASSRVRLVLQSQSDRPLICHRVDKVTKLRHTDVSDVPNVRILTDRNGELEIEVDPENPTFWLYVYSGNLLLARVPYAPGLIPLDTMKLPDDSLRLSVEGGLYLFRDQLVDSVAQKAVHMSLARKAAAEGDVPGLEVAIKQLGALPGKEHFERELNSVRTPALAKADQQKNSAVKRRIESLCRDMSESLTKFYATDKRLQEAEEFEKLRQSAETKSATAPSAVIP